MRAHDAADCCAGETTGIADAIMSEIATLLDQFAETGEGIAVDLRGLPMTDADRALLEHRLGRGEVSAAIDVAGISEVWETAYSGVWWVRHRGSDNRIVSEEIVVTRVPAILMSHEDDVRDAARRLREDIAALAAAGNSTALDSAEVKEETAHV
jgi:hydrogenase-1 operon protein HyaF